MNKTVTASSHALLDQLKQNWDDLHPLDRAKAVASLKASGLSIRFIAREIGRKETSLRHLLKSLEAPAADLAAARTENISTNELVRRGKAANQKRSAQLRETAKRHLENQAGKAAKLICNWVSQTQLHGPSREAIVQDVRWQFGMREMAGTLPMAPRGLGLPTEEIIRRSRPADDDSIDIAWFAQWLYKWSFFAFPDPELRDMALNLALALQVKEER